MQKYKKPDLSSFKDRKNPFSISLSIPIVKWESKESFKKDEDNDILFNSYLIEVVQSVKVYQSSSRRNVINDLTPNACKLLLWIQQELKPNRDYFWLNKERYIKETTVAYNTYKKSISNLVENCLLTPTEKNDVYWINPDFFFPGNRIKKYPRNLVITQDRTQE
jgi:hypothetical protein